MVVAKVRTFFSPGPISGSREIKTGGTLRCPRCFHDCVDVVLFA
jgi:hypothetical protein